MCIYNEKIKELFLQNYTESSQVTYRRIFQKSCSTEEMLGKDLYDFNLEEIEDVLYNLSPTTFHSSVTNGRIITAYISWAIEQGLRKNNINPLKTYGSDYFRKFIDPSAKIFFTDSEIMEIEDFCNNAQDAAMIRLLFEGVSGKMFWEIRNLKKEDVDFENKTLKLTNENGEIRILEISDRALSLVEKAMNQTKYYKKNGEMESENPVLREYTDLIENDYVFRPSKTKVDDPNEPIKKNVIFRRISTISELFGLPHLVAHNIIKSGILYMAKKEIENGHQINTDLYRKIAQRYAINNFYSLRDFVTKENIESLYDDDQISQGV